MRRHEVYGDLVVNGQPWWPPDQQPIRARTWLGIRLACWRWRRRGLRPRVERDYSDLWRRVR